LWHLTVIRVCGLIPLGDCEFYFVNYHHRQIIII